MVTAVRFGEEMNRLLDFFVRAEHKIYITIKRMRLKNKTMTVLSSNCNGAYMLHDLGCPFNSPTVNLYFLPEHFLKFVRNPEVYLSAEVKEVHLPDIDFPVGQLDDILLFFMHYDTFAQAKEAWVRRAGRVDMHNVYLVMTDKNGCTYEQIREFDELPYQNKVIFTHRQYREFASACYIPGFEDDAEVGILSDWKPQLLRRRWLDDFDSVRFFNQKCRR